MSIGSKKRVGVRRVCGDVCYNEYTYSCCSVVLRNAISYSTISYNITEYNIT